MKVTILSATKLVAFGCGKTIGLLGNTTITSEEDSVGWMLDFNTT